MQQRFGLPFWQFALTATDANRFAIRLARQIRKRHKILVLTGAITAPWTKFHHSEDGVVQARRGNIGPPVDPAVTTKVVEFNRCRGAGGRWPLATWPAAGRAVMTNVGIVHPEPGYHQALRQLTDKFGTLLISTRPPPSVPGRAATLAPKVSILTSLFLAKLSPAECPAQPTDFTDR